LIVTASSRVVLPVTGLSKKGAVCVPSNTHLVKTLVPSATYSRTVSFRSGMATIVASSYCN
jgi:hypothetical protein